MYSRAVDITLCKGTQNCNPRIATVDRGVQGLNTFLFLLAAEIW
ncbi:hypothetical protein H4W00_001509 [Psychrobacter sp. PL19]